MQVYRPVDQSSAAARITFGPIAVTITRRMVSCCGYLTLLACVLALFMIPNSHGRVTGASAAEEGTLDPPASGNPSLLPPEDLPLVGENEPGQPPLLPLPPPPPELEPRATSHLSRVKCIPKVCSADKHFVSDWNVLAEHSSFTVLSSTPGSGNTFVRSIVEEGTRVWSGSVYHDRALERTYGFRGEMVNPWATAHSRFSVIKSHFPMFNQKVLPHRVTGAIHILRAPFDAMLSEFNREYGNGHTSSASAWAVRGRLAPWVEKRHNVWVWTAKLWGGPQFWNHSLHDMNNDDTVSTFEVSRVVRVADKDPVPVLIMFYEDFLHDFEEASRRLFVFLKERLGDAMPSVDEAVTCAVAGRNREAGMRRHDTKQEAVDEPRTLYNPFRSANSPIGPGQVAKLCAAFAPYWFEAKWGSCTSAMLQGERRIASRRIAKLVEDVCQ